MTVPLDIRQALNWPNNEIVVKVTTIRDGFRVEKLPISHPQHPKKKLTKKEWDKIYKDFEEISRSGRQDISLKEFVRHDRDTRD